MDTCLVYVGIQQHHFAVPGGEPMSLTIQLYDMWCRFQGVRQDNCRELRTNWFGLQSSRFLDRIN